MEWRGSCEIEITDLGDRLEVLARAHAGALDWMIPAIVTSTAVYLFAKASRTIAVFAAAVALLSWFNSVRKGNETRLIARSDGFIAEGNIDRAFAQQVLVSVDDIHSIGYFDGHEGDPQGQYALSRWSQTCLVPGLDEASCRRIQSAIESKFPQMHFGQEPISSLLGDGPEIITLGLSQNNSAGASEQPK